MKPPKTDNPWSFWQPLFLRMFVKRRMRPMTPSRAFKTRDKVAILYFLCTVVGFHLFAINEINVLDFRKNDDIKQALKVNADEGKIIRIENFKLKEVIDFDRDDYEHLLQEEDKN